MFLWPIGKALLWPIYHTVFRIRVEGLENVPKEGGAIICGNHFRAHDPLVMGLHSPRKIHFMAKAELFENPLLRWVIQDGLGSFPVKRGKADLASLKRSIEVLESGECFGIFPEGTRNRIGVLAKAEPGTAYLALKSGAPVIPVGISGTYKLFSPLIIKFGPPVDLSPYKSGRLNSETLEAAGEAIMAGIAAQLI